MNFAATGAGRNRDPWEIRKFLNVKGTNMTKLARSLGVSVNLVHVTVTGARNNRKVLTALRELGCPEKVLSLPEDMKEENL